MHRISRWIVDIPPNSSSRSTQHAIYLIERLRLSLNRKSSHTHLSSCFISLSHRSSVTTCGH